MTTPTFCTDCGHELGIGRFCTNCGRPVPGRHPEATPTVSAPAAPSAASSPQPRSAPVVPPSADQVPPSARYPMYADAPPTVTAPTTPTTPTTWPQPTPPPVPVLAPSYPAAPKDPRPWLPWVIALVVLALVAALGAFLLLGGDDGEQAADDSRDDRSQSGDPSGEGSEPGAPEQPDATGTGAPVDAPDPDDIEDLTSDVTATVPSIAQPSRDRKGKPVRFVVANMWDGRPRTAWRMAGDGTGETLTFDLGEEVVITDVGMINGYAKVDGPINWYRSNRRVRAVQWEFDDGTRITQEFGDKQAMQMAAIGPVTTQTIKVHLLTVTAPGKTDGRDFTAISEVRFLGATAD
ncbi:NADase-type glycan-binding domain-containing protein [Nocardioides sp. CPCC 206347]|uniref:NADase-type glycan-binding domain-containing protein n=1 Tax=Nocardioides sp. CPCC 206347 TaxID=3406463 RepID=UPI003B43178B